MKKIIIVNNNMDSGGIQKALVNLLKAVSSDHNVTLLLFSKSGALIDEIPDNVNIVTPSSLYKTLGLSKKELFSYPHLFAVKAVFKMIARLLGKRKAIKVLGIFQRKIKGYDIAISYSHLTDSRSFDNGCAEFVLDKIEAVKKSCFIHCDYKDSGTCSDANNNLYRMYDNIICVSHSVMGRFLELIPDIKDKTFALRNFYDLSVIDRSKCDTVSYDDKYINLLIVARLSPEKGQDRAIRALKASKREDIKLHLVGDGPSRENLKRLCSELGVEDKVVFYGEQKNPYRYMLFADYLFVPSIHEAAPLVFDEAHALGLRILSTKLLSSAEMLFSDDIECENSPEGICEILSSLNKNVKSDALNVSNSETTESFANYVKDSL